MKRLILLQALIAALNAVPWTHVQAKTVRPVTTPWLRTTGDIHHTKISHDGRFLAFTNREGRKLQILDTTTKKVFRVSNKDIGGSFFWAPDGKRLVYRQHVRDRSHQIKSQVIAFDLGIGRNVPISNLAYATGFLTYDPRDLRYSLMHRSGVHSHRLLYPDQRLARWQIAQRTETGKWVAAPMGIYWLTGGGKQIERLDDDGAAVESFSVSPSGDSIAWATKAEVVYISHQGQTPLVVGKGRDPSWHPESHLIVYVAARSIGKSTTGYDLRVADRKGSGQYITSSRASLERWPVWHSTGHQIIYTLDGTTDLYALTFKRTLTSKADHTSKSQAF